MIDAYFQGMSINDRKIFETTFDSHSFLYIAQKVCYILLKKIATYLAFSLTFISLYTKAKYVTKFISSFGCLVPVQHH